MPVIYAIRHPFTGEIVYVGKTDNFTERVKTHLRNANNQKDKRLLYCWMRPFLEYGIRPEFKIIERCELANGSKRERYHINKIKARFNFANIEKIRSVNF